MTKYATFDQDGFPTGFYSPDIHGARTVPVYSQDAETLSQGEVIGSRPNPDCQIPFDAVEITTEQWLELLQNPSRRKWQSGDVVAFQPPLPSASGDDINGERARRILAGTVIDGVHVTGSDEDARNLMSLALGAQMRLAARDNETLTTFRDGDNVDHELTPEQLLSLWQQSAAYVSALYASSWALKEMEPIPRDFSDDSYWPRAFEMGGEN